MLVLRRRVEEVIVFEGGLALTVLEVGDRRAWLGLEAPTIEGSIALAVLEVDDDAALVGIRSPSSISSEKGTTRVELAEGPYDPRAPMLSVFLGLGERLSFNGVELEVTSLRNQRATFRLELPCLSAPVSVTVQSITGSEVRIGIEAPEDLRVYRKELWVELLGANQAAAGWTSGDLEGLVPTKEH